MTGIHENGFTSAKYCVASQMELEDDTEALYHALFQMQRWQCGSCKILLAFVSLKENTRPAFSERQQKWSTQAVTSARSLRMSPPAQTMRRKRLHFHLHFPPAAGDPSWLAWASRSSHNQPRFSLLEPAGKLPCSSSCCRHSYGSSCCTPSSPFQTLWLLPHWPKSLYNQPWSTLNRTCGDSGTPRSAEASGWLRSMCYSSAASGI